MDIMTEKKSIISRIKMIFVMLIVFFIRLGLYVQYILGVITDDSVTYIDYDIHSGVRTPGYPLIVDLFQWIMPRYFKEGVAVFQMLVSYFAVFVMYKAIIKAMQHMGAVHENLALFATLLFGCFPAVFMYDFWIQTESLAMSFTVFFIYFAVGFIADRKVSQGVMMVVISFFGMLIKTGLFVYTGDAIILLILVFIFDKESRKIVLKTGIAVAIVLLLYGIWIGQVYRDTGVRSLSSLPPIHDLGKCLRSGAYQFYPDEELVNRIDSVLEETEGDVRSLAVTSSVMNVIAEGEKDTREINKKVTAFNSICKKANNYYFYKWDITNVFLREELMADLREIIIDGTYIQRDGMIINLINVCMLDNDVQVSVIYFVAFAVLLGGIVCGVRKKIVPFLHIGIWGGILSVLISVPIGTFGDWSRTLSYVLPFFFAGISIILYDLCEGDVAADHNNAGSVSG